MAVRDATVKQSPDFVKVPMGTSDGIPVAFKHLVYRVITTGKQKLNIINDVTGSFLPGTLTALMGPSGCGKTTLLDTLAGRVDPRRVSGAVLYSGQQASQSFLRRWTGYVEQFDTLIPNLTVEEMLRYTCELKTPRGVSAATKHQNVESVIEALGLSGCRKVQIGSALSKGISGGQLKRTNIGIALVAEPKVLFLDEPTSGLDSYMANEVMTMVRKLAHGGMTICATIHSPTPYAFTQFDHVMVLLKGRMVFCGRQAEVLTHLSGLGLQASAAHQLEDVHTSDAEWLVAVTTHADADPNGAAKLAQAYLDSPMAAAAARQVEAIEQAGAEDGDVALVARTRRATATPTWWAYLIMLKFRMRRDFVDPLFLGPRIMEKIVIALLVMSLFWRTGKDGSQSNAPNIVALLFMQAILPGFTASAYIPSIILERPLYIRERSDGLYRAITFLCVKITEEMALSLPVSIISTSIVFWTVQLQGSYALFWLTIWMTTMVGVALGYWIAAVSPNMDVANAAVPAYVVVQLFFAGLFLRWDDIPAWWKWYTYLDFLKWPWGALMINQFEGSNIIAYGDMEVLDYYSLRDWNKWMFFGIGTCFFGLFFFTAWLALALRPLRRH